MLPMFVKSFVQHFLAYLLLLGSAFQVFLQTIAMRIGGIKNSYVIQGDPRPRIEKKADGKNDQIQAQWRNITLLATGQVVGRQHSRSNDQRLERAKDL